MVSQNAPLRRAAPAELGQIVVGMGEILVARGAFLPIPALLVHHGDGGQDREPLDGHGDVRQIRDRTVAILEVIGVEEFLGPLFADLAQRLLHGERRARVLGHGVGLHLGLDAVDRIDGRGGRLSRLGVAGSVLVGHRERCYSGIVAAGKSRVIGSNRKNPVVTSEWLAHLYDSAGGALWELRPSLTFAQTDVRIRARIWTCF